MHISKHKTAELERAKQYVNMHERVDNTKLVQQVVMEYKNAPIYVTCSV